MYFKKKTNANQEIEIFYLKVKMIMFKYPELIH